MMDSLPPPGSSPLATTASVASSAKERGKPWASVMAAFVLGAGTFFAVEHWPRAVAPAAKAKTRDSSLPPAVALPLNEAATATAIRFYTGRVKRDPEDTRSQNALAEHYLQRVRESGNEDDLPLALAAARASLTAIPAEQNIGGLTALAQRRAGQS